MLRIAFRMEHGMGTNVINRALDFHDDIASLINVFIGRGACMGEVGRVDIAIL